MTLDFWIIWWHSQIYPLVLAHKHGKSPIDTPENQTNANQVITLGISMGKPFQKIGVENDEAPKDVPPQASVEREYRYLQTSSHFVAGIYSIYIRVYIYI